MTSKWSALSKPDQLQLSAQEIHSLPLLRQFLKDRPGPFGQVLLGAEDKPWTKQDVARFESSVMKYVDKGKIADFLSIARSAAHYWSVRKQRVVPLPRYYVRQAEKDDSLFDRDYAQAVSQYRLWRDQLSNWVGALHPANSIPPCRRPLLLASLVCSAILHGGAIGDSFVAAIIRAIEHKQESTFAIGKRIHIELILRQHGVADAETRLWLPDALTATLWHWIDPTDVKRLLEAVTTRNGKRPPSDREIHNRLRDIIKSARPAEELRGLVGLQRSCRIVAPVQLSPVLAHYCGGEIASSSVKRQHLRRLFPGGELIQFKLPGNLGAAPSAAVSVSSAASAGSPPRWGNDLLEAAQSNPPRLKDVQPKLQAFAGDRSRDLFARRLAGFGLSLLSSTLYSGKRLRVRDLPKALECLAIALSTPFAGRDAAKIGAREALDLYVAAIKARPERLRGSLIKWILEFDLYIRACVRAREPIAKSKIPWPPPEIPSVDVNLATHEEYAELLRRIDDFWDVRDSERRRRMIRLLTILSFRCGLRRSELRSLRLAGVLIRGVPEILIWPRKGEPRKSGRARRRVPIAALLSSDELNELRQWHRERFEQDKAKPEDRLFALPGLTWIPNSLFDKLNAFLREQSRWGNGDDGIHGHTLRHAYSGWLFAFLTLSQTEEPATLFPDLVETNTWLNQRERLAALYGRTQPAGKDPAFTAYLSAHADFHTTAQTYIHLFPWLVAAALDASDVMIPDEQLVIELVKCACQITPSKLESWRAAGRVHNVPVQLLKSCTGVHVDRPPKGKWEALPVPVLSCASWAEEAWKSLMRLCTTKTNMRHDAKSVAMSNRANYMFTRTTSDGRPRHLMELWTSDRLDQSVRKRIACPAKPRHKCNPVSEDLCSLIVDLYREDPDLVRDAASIFVKHLEERGWVRFKSTKDSPIANRYIAFLCALKLGPKKMRLVSGATEKESDFRKAWKSKLIQPNLVIEPSDKSRNFGPITSLSIRPIAGEKGATHTVHAGFRFIMAMTYVAFGPDPVWEKEADTP